MHFDEYVEAIRREGEALVAAASSAGVETRVPSCPEWNAGDLLAHMGHVYYWAAATVRAGAADHPAQVDIEVPPPPQRAEWVAAGVRHVADAIAAAGPDAPAWSWSDDHTAGFWARRQAHETTIHRVDADLAAGGVPTPVPAALAVDGIDELLEMVQAAGRVRGDGQTIHLHCTDAEGEWLVRLTPDGLDVAHEHAKGDVAARGPASDLLLFVYGRAGTEPLEVFGDAAVLSLWQERARI